MNCKGLQDVQVRCKNYQSRLCALARQTSRAQVCCETYLCSGLVSVAEGDIGVCLGAQRSCCDCNTQSHIDICSGYPRWDAQAGIHTLHDTCILHGMYTKHDMYILHEGNSAVVEGNNGLVCHQGKQFTTGGYPANQADILLPSRCEAYQQ